MPPFRPRIGGFFLLTLMSGMSDSLPYWIAAALALFWFVGAYNRLVRLRSAALQAYAALDAALARQLEFVQSRASEANTSGPPARSGARGGPVRVRASGRGRASWPPSLAATRAATARPRPYRGAGHRAACDGDGLAELHPDAVVSFDADGTLSRPAPLAGREEPPSGNVRDRVAGAVGCGGNRHAVSSILRSRNTTRPSPSFPRCWWRGSCSCGMPRPCADGRLLAVTIEQVVRFFRFPAGASPTSPPLWRQLQLTAGALASIRGGVSGSVAFEAVEPALRPGVQALGFQVLR